MELPDTTRLEEFFSSDVVMFGMMGVGKTTLIEHVQRFVPLRYVSLGAITRSLSPATPLGQQVSYLIERGGVWPLEVISEIAMPYLKVSSPMVLDGIPKYPHEAEWLKNQLAIRQTQPVKGLVVQASEGVARSRLQGGERQFRPETPGQVEDRITTYQNHLEHITQILEPVMPEVVHINNDMLSPFETIHELSRSI